jgi:phosphoribosylformylglycinamidine (FGAM) synthase PurS component
MVKTEVLVKIAAPDPWSFTVFDALTRKFGYEDVVDVDRIKSWELTFDLERDAALDTTEMLLRETVLLANPNRDVWVLRRQAGELPGGFWYTSTGATEAFIVKVTDLEDIVGASIASILRSRLGILEVKSVSFSTIWGLQISRASPDPREVATRVAVARSWRSGLLANPHCQRARVYGAEEYLIRENGQ